MKEVLEFLRKPEHGHSVPLYFADYAEAALEGDIERMENVRKRYMANTFFATEAEIENFDRILDNARAGKRANTENRILLTVLRRGTTYPAPKWRRMIRGRVGDIRRLVGSILDPDNPENGWRMLERMHWRFFGEMSKHPSLEPLGRSVYNSIKKNKNHVPVTLLSNMMVLLHPYIVEVIRRRKNG